MKRVSPKSLEHLSGCHRGGGSFGGTLRGPLRMTVLCGAVSLLAALSVATANAQETKTPGIPPHGAAVVLFDGKDLNAFDTYINAHAPGPKAEAADAAAGVIVPKAGELNAPGLNAGPQDVFIVENGLLHVSGKKFGYVITKQPFDHYYLRAEFKWGEGTFAPRDGKARDSGILFNIQGEQKVWPRSIEFQITEGGTGDFWMTDGAAISPKNLDGTSAPRVEGPAGKAKRSPRYGGLDLVNTTGWRSPTGEVEVPHGEWNLLELVNDGNDVKQYVNGKLVNEGTDPFPDSGKILLQSEGAEVFYRNVMLYPLIAAHQKR